MNNQFPPQFPGHPQYQQRPAKRSPVPVWIAVVIATPIALTFFVCAGCFVMMGEAIKRTPEQIAAAEDKREAALEYDRTRARADEETQAERLAKIQQFADLGLFVRGPIRRGDKSAAIYVNAKLWAELDMFTRKDIQKLLLFWTAEAVNGWHDPTQEYYVTIYDASSGDRLETCSVLSLTARSL